MAGSTSSNIPLHITESDITGDCKRLNRRFDLVEGQASTAVAAANDQQTIIAGLQKDVKALQATGTAESADSVIVAVRKNVSNSSTSIATTNLLINGQMAQQGAYLLGITVVAATTGSGSVTVTITYNNGRRVATISLPLPLTGANDNTVTYQIYTSGTAHITYATTYAATGTYDLHIRLVSLG